jgi:glycosyltransferase involved in cell wall biosynthesis
LDTVLDAASILKRAPDGDRFRILLLGDGANKAFLRQRAKADGLDNVIFVDSVSKDQVVRYWSLLDASIIHLKKDELFTTVIPSKLFECMGMAIPVLHGVEGESADIVEREDVGLLFEPENPEALVAGLRRLSNNPELLARYRSNGPLSAKRYDRSSLAVTMLNMLKNLAER